MQKVKEFFFVASVRFYVNKYDPQGSPPLFYSIKMP